MRGLLALLTMVFLAACGAQRVVDSGPIDVRVDRNLQAFDYGPQTIFEQNLIKVPGTVTEKRVQNSKVVGFMVQIDRDQVKAPIRHDRYLVSIHSSTLVGLRADKVTVVFTEAGQVFRILLPGRQ